MDTFNPQPQIDKTAKRQKAVLYTLAGIGLALVLVAAGYVGVQALRQAPNAFSSLGAVLSGIGLNQDGGEQIIVTADPTVATSSADILVSWEHREQEVDGSYTFTYDCRDGLVLEAVSENNTETIFCNTPLHFVNTDNTLVFKATLNEEEARAETRLTIAFTPNGKSEISVSGETTLVVVNPEEVLGPEVEGDVQGDTTTVTTTPPPVTAGPRNTQTFDLGTTTEQRFSDPDGTPDLSITINAVGTVDRDGDFTEGEPVDRDDRAAVQFTVTNLGTKETGEWRFEAELPTRPERTFRSPEQDSLFPGERIDFTIGFDRLTRDDEGKVTITLDPRDDVDESNENNNEEDIEFEIEN